MHQGTKVCVCLCVSVCVCVCKTKCPSEEVKSDTQYVLQPKRRNRLFVNLTQNDPYDGSLVQRTVQVLVQLDLEVYRSVARVPSADLTCIIHHNLALV